MREYIISLDQIGELAKCAANEALKAASNYEIKSEFTFPMLQEVVRCIDCKHFYCLCVDACVCTRNKEKLMPWVEPDGFCKWGERKDENGH